MRQREEMRSRLGLRSSLKTPERRRKLPKGMPERKLPEHLVREIIIGEQDGGDMCQSQTPKKTTSQAVTRVENTPDLPTFEAHGRSPDISRATGERMAISGHRTGLTARLAHLPRSRLLQFCGNCFNTVRSLSSCARRFGSSLSFQPFRGTCSDSNSRKNPSNKRRLEEVSKQPAGWDSMRSFLFCDFIVLDSHDRKSLQ